jgi:hypothetical protein
VFVSHMNEIYLKKSDGVITDLACDMLATKKY